MSAAVRHGVVVVLLILSAACGDSPTSPTRAGQPVVPAPPPPPPPPPPPVVPLTGPSRSFAFHSELSYPVMSYTRESLYVLYDSGAFALQLGGGLGYGGRFTEANGVIDFSWDGWSLAGPWGARGTLAGDTLTVRYNIIMQLTDFEDAVYMFVR